MTIRRLIFGNWQDFEQECLLNSLAPDDGVYSKIVAHNANYKWFRVPADAILPLKKICKIFPGSTILSPDSPNAKTELILSIPCSQLDSFAAALRQAGHAVVRDMADRLMELENLRSLNSWCFHSAGRDIFLRFPVLMGILNVTPDSFSDGGLYISPAEAIRRATEMWEAGASIIDIGGESSRPGAEEVPLEEEWARIGPVIAALAREADFIISVDTYKSEVARRALQEGAHIINDISALRFDPKMVTVAAQGGAPVVLMHMKGNPRNMQKNPTYQNLMEEIYFFLRERIRYARDNGVQQIIVDPGIGFGKRSEDNFEIIRRVGELRDFGFPVLVGPSRKSFIGNVLGVPPAQRLTGTVTSVIQCAAQGAHIFRVHDVSEVRQSLEISQAIFEKKSTLIL